MTQPDRHGARAFERPRATKHNLYRVATCTIHPSISPLTLHSYIFSSTTRVSPSHAMRVSVGNRWGLRTERQCLEQHV
ncbi:hypothetical protein BFJ65_g18234 [Fusarium oxysporum f. sp. cepae]|uniref:Uncharacterized protein n=1 Tax=Fusarium oxysporum f. sp. cepae TaxID=396571 RepID=A0A3L6MQH3_FUSOX|nr:hypothetical protein BFJ65_g18234 [Fusarium oxysporum f. sp. cepae]RKK34744.1 hypothetical protein BFJ67_g13637 [Fusarium oxysporum f. sp. cepae]